MNQSRFMHAFLSDRKMLFAFVKSIVSDRETAEDVFQEVAVVALSKCAGFTEGTDLGAWLREIARRLILKSWGTRSRRHLLLEPEAIDAIAAAYDRTASKTTGDWWEDREGRLRECLDRLPERSRRMIDLRYRELLDFAAMASRLQSTVGSIQARLSQIREILRRCVKAELSGSG